MTLKIENFSAITDFGPVGEANPISFEVNAGEILTSFQCKGLSLLFKVLMGKGKINSGEIYLEEQNIQKYYNESNQLYSTWLNKFGFAHRERGLISNQTIYENIALPWKFFAHNLENTLTPEDVLKEVDIPEQYWNQRPHIVPWKVKKWALLGRSSILLPKVILLDDPTILLDFKDLTKLSKWIKLQSNRGAIVLIGTDNAPFGLALADKVLDIETGLAQEINQITNEKSLLKVGQAYKEFFEENHEV